MGIITESQNDGMMESQNPESGNQGITESQNGKLIREGWVTLVPPGKNHGCIRTSEI